MAEYVNIKTDSIDKNVPTKETFENSIPKSKLITLSASDWDTNAKTQTIAVDGVLADEDSQLITITPKSVSIIDYANAGVYASGQAADSLTFTCSTVPTVDLQIYVTIETVKIIKDYLTFSSPNSFTLKTGNAAKNWDGTLEYSTNAEDWSVWDGTTTLNSSSDNKLYLRGTGNSKICRDSDTTRWVLTGSNISCNGNIEILLDYQTVFNGEHPAMAGYCYSYMFAGCTSLVTAPALPATTLAFVCYYNMFNYCSKIKLSTTKTGTYTQEYRIPTSGTGTDAEVALESMFEGTGGTFTGTPTINTTYYLDSSNTIV